MWWIFFFRVICVGEGLVGMVIGRIVVVEIVVFFGRLRFLLVLI